MDINQLPVVGAGREKPRLVLQYTLDGEVLCKRIASRYVPMPLRTVELAHGFDLPEYTEPMARIWALIEETKKHDPGRLVPMLAGDVVKRYQLCNSKVYKRMIQYALLKEALIPIINTKTGKNLGTRLVVYFTPQGRAFIRKYVDPNYAKTENT